MAPTISAHSNDNEEIDPQIPGAFAKVSMPSRVYTEGITELLGPN